MRIGGAFPFGQGNVPVGLAGGEQWYVPPGNYYLQLGSVSLLQVFDGINQIWRNIGFPGGNLQVASADGFNYRIVNMSGVVGGIQITNAGSGATVNGIGTAVNGVSIGFGAAPANGIAAQAYAITGGKLSGLTIANAGSGFVFPPVLVLDPPPIGGIQATATCTISGGAINAVTLQNAGAGYLAVPNVYIVPQYLLPVQGGAPINATPPLSVIPPGLIAPLLGSLSSQPPFMPGPQWPAAAIAGTGASITVNGLTGSGTLTGAVVTQYGVGYTGTTIPTIAFTGGGLAGGVAATAIMSFSVISLGTAGTAGAGYTVGTPWISDIGELTAPLTNTDFCNGVFQPRPARGRLTATTGFTGTAALVEDSGFGIQSVPNIGTTQFGTLVTTVSTTTAVVGGVFDISLLQPAVED
jgi:hypothetical protein